MNILQTPIRGPELYLSGLSPAADDAEPLYCIVKADNPLITTSGNGRTVPILIFDLMGQPDVRHSWLPIRPLKSRRKSRVQTLLNPFPREVRWSPTQWGQRRMETEYRSRPEALITLCGVDNSFPFDMRCNMSPTFTMKASSRGGASTH